MNGESSVKVEGGKLVKVQIEYEEEIEDVKIRGDFFIQPPEALEKLEKVLEGMPKNVETEDIIEKLKEVDAELIGFSAEDIAEAVEEALKPNFRVINDGRHSEAMHHALDEVLTEKVAEGEIQPTIRFWYRENTAVPMGRFQAYHDEVEHDYIEDQGIEVVRRNTGGGAMFAEPGKVITYSLYMPEKMVNDNIEESYKELDEFAVETLQDLGLDVEYVPLNDIEHEEGKIGGAAQLRKNGAVLHHTMISYELDTEKMLKTLRIGKEKVSDKAIESAEKRVARISDHIDHAREEVIDSLLQSFQESCSIENQPLKDEEIEEARQRVEEKFSKDEWNQKL
jgi:lipoate-protein ligase A